MNLTKVQIIKVLSDEGDMRLDRWFRRRFPDMTQGQLQKMLRKKEIKVDGQRAETNTRLAIGQEVRVPPLADRIVKKDEKPKADKKKIAPEAIEQIQAAVVYKDDDVIAINKRAGLPVQGGSGVSLSVDDLLEYLKFEKDERPKLVHRLDKDTSGVLLLARNRKTAELLTKAFKEKTIEKTYWAICIGVPKMKQGKIDLPLLKQGKAGTEKMVVDKKDGQRAISLYTVMETAGKEMAWLELHPVTGRTHQLRAHMEAVGHPLLGDGKYGGKAAFIEGMSNNLHLHSREIIFRNAKGKEVTVTADLPKHMQQSWDMLGF